MSEYSFKKYYPLAIIVIYFLFQLPFLTADPDVLADPFSRGAWTDEGLYTLQIRNFFNHNYYNSHEVGTFELGPVFNLVQLPFFYFFGTTLLVSRMVTLGLTLLVLFLFLKNKKLMNFGLFLSLFTMLEFHVFQFSHYGMVEMICVNFILLSLYFFLKINDDENNRRKIKMIFLSSLFLFLCYSSKFQYFYVSAILPIAFLLISLHTVIRNKKTGIKIFTSLIWSLLFCLFFLGIYYLLWYMPNKDVFNNVAFNLSGGRFPYTVSGLIGSTRFNFIREFWIEEFKVNIILFCSVLVIAAVYFLIKRNKAVNSSILIFSLIWILAELHKLPMYYLPYRYIISLIFAAGVFTSAIFTELTCSFNRYKWVFITVALITGVYNLTFSYHAFERRTYQLLSINNYLGKYDFKDKPIIGQWAPSVCWKNKAIVFPVPGDDVNNINLLEKYKPAVIVSETDEMDSNEAYKKQGVDLRKISDSSRVFDVWHFKLALYWINPKLVK